MILSGRTGLKGCAARTGQPALALDPRPVTQRRAVMSFAFGVATTGAQQVTFLTGRKSVFSNGDRHGFNFPFR
jgi:hypothetical protein